MAIVLNGDVELLPDGKAKVASQTNGTTTYHVVNGACDCKDFAKAPSHQCKHRLAYGIHKRAMNLMKQKLAQLDEHAHQTHQDDAGATNGRPDDRTKKPHSPIDRLPEAPASVNCHITLAGRQVQITLRDSNETRLLSRLEALLKHFPAEGTSEQEPSKGWCSIHQCQMTQHHNKKGSWFSHKTADGWCHGKER